MRVLMISTDRLIFKERSPVRARMIEYGKAFGELHVIIFSTRKYGKDKVQLSKETTVYPTHSRVRWCYIADAMRIGRQLLKERGEWVLTAQDPFETGLVAKRLSKKFSVSYQVQVHTDFLSPHFKAHSLLNRIRLLLARQVLPRASCIRVVGERIRKSIIEQYKLNAEPKVLPVHVDVERLVKLTPKRNTRRPFPQFQQLVLVVSRLESEKNVALAIDVFAQVAEKYKKSGLLIAGEGGQMGMLRQHAKTMGVAHRTLFLGAVDNVYSLIRTADIVLNTSKYEGYGRVLVEAAASGTAIVSTDVGIVGELLEPEREALICPVGDVACLSEKLSALLEERRLREEIGRMAQQKAVRKAQTQAQNIEQQRQLLETCKR